MSEPIAVHIYTGETDNPTHHEINQEKNELAWKSVPDDDKAAIDCIMRDVFEELLDGDISRWLPYSARAEEGGVIDIAVRIKLDEINREAIRLRVAQRNEPKPEPERRLMIEPFGCPMCDVEVVIDKANIDVTDDTITVQDIRTVQAMPRLRQVKPHPS